MSRVAYRQYQDHSKMRTGQCELDSHADTCMAGANCVVLETTDQRVSVSAFMDQHKTFQDIPIVAAATAYDYADTGVTYILILGQAIYMGDTMPNTLLCPNQLRANGIIVDNCPKHLVPPNRPSAHALVCQDQDIQIALNLQGATSYFVTRTPTVNEIETCQWAHLSDEHNWDPHSDQFQQQEERYDDLQEYSRDPTSRNIYSYIAPPTPHH
jgi:hypothetical protein